MAILVSMQVGPVDWNKFKGAMDTVGEDKPAGLNWRHVYRGEQDGNRVLVLEEWDSHDAMHAYQEKVGDEFNAKAGTEGMQWTTGTWELAQ
jgi:hypothetical protein